MTRADCGHEYTSPETSGPSGYAHLTRDDGTDATICYKCAETNERIDFLKASRYTAYLSSDGRALTTWTGATLAIVTSSHATAQRSIFGDTPVNGRALGTDGRVWSFRSSGRGTCAHLRAMKAADGRKVAA